MPLQQKPSLGQRWPGSKQPQRPCIVQTPLQQASSAVHGASPARHTRDGGRPGHVMAAASSAVRGARQTSDIAYRAGAFRAVPCVGIAPGRLDRVGSLSPCARDFTNRSNRSPCIAPPSPCSPFGKGIRASCRQHARRSAQRHRANLPRVADDPVLGKARWDVPLTGRRAAGIPRSWRRRHAERVRGMTAIEGRCRRCEASGPTEDARASVQP